MDFRHVLRIVFVVASLFITYQPANASETTVVTEGHYVMGDSDTLTIAEERVLRLAQRRAVEEAGVYIESAFQDIEKASSGTSFQSSSLAIRTIAASITKTEILESRRSFKDDRPSFYIRIRAVVNLDSLQAAVRRWQSEEQFAEHFRRLQSENAELKAQLRELKTAPTVVRTLTIEPLDHTKDRERVRILVEKAILSHHLPRKLDLISQAAALDPQSVEPLIVRGQTYLRLVSAAYSNKSRPNEYSEYIDNARMDFDRAILLDPKNTWAFLGSGDVNTWLHRPVEAAHAFEQVLELDPFFDLARYRIINLYTAEARKLISLKQWSSALTVLQKCLPPATPDSWILYQKEAYLLRSNIYKKLGRPTQAIDDLSAILRADPTDRKTLLARAALYQKELHGRAAKDDLERACMLGATAACEQLP
jgi:tetratricopeptide (TPR) repeat protein